MKMIISGRKYDTETAICIGSYSTTCSVRDFRHYTEELYRKKTGEFFLYGEGGPMSPYRKQVERNAWEESYAIIPYTEEQARTWAEEHMDADDYEDVFGAVAE